MPFSLRRLRIGRNTATTADTLSSPQTPSGEGANGDEDAVRASTTHQKSSLRSASPASRFSSWLLRIRSRKERGADQPSGRPPTPTPHLSLSLAPSAAAKEANTKTLRRVRSQSTPKADEKEIKDDSDDDDEELISEEERERLETFASGLRGLITQMHLADEQARLMPPMKNAEGTPLSPITEAEELEDELDADSAPRVITKAPSVDEITNLDYGDDLDGPELDELEAESEVTPRWHPDVAELVESEMGLCCWTILPCIPSSPKSPAFDDSVGGRVDDATIEAELARDCKVLPEREEERLEAETETEDELEYFSAPSLPALSSGEEEEDDSNTASGPAFGLHLRGLSVNHTSLYLSDSSSDSLITDNLKTVEDVMCSPSTPRALPRQRLPSLSPSASRSTAEPESSSSKSTRQRAITLPVTTESRERALPALPPLSIPSTSNNQVKTESRDVSELLRTVAQLQHEKARLEQELACANRRIERQDTHLASLTAQIALLRVTLLRIARADSDSETEKSSEISIPIVVCPPLESPDTEVDTHEEADAGLVSSAPPTMDGVNPLSTPPATPDRRAATSLSDATDSSEEVGDEEESTPKPARGLMRRKSAGAASAMKELGVGRAQAQSGFGGPQNFDIVIALAMIKLFGGAGFLLST